LPNVLTGPRSPTLPYIFRYVPCDIPLCISLFSPFQVYIVFLCYGLIALISFIHPFFSPSSLWALLISCLGWRIIDFFFSGVVYVSILLSSGASSWGAQKAYTGVSGCFSSAGISRLAYKTLFDPFSLASGDIFFSQVHSFWSSLFLDFHS